jgi:hypothetical protein
MYWSKVQTHGKSPARPLRAHTVNLVGEIMYVFGGCDARACFNSIYVFDAGKPIFPLSSPSLWIGSDR